MNYSFLLLKASGCVFEIVCRCFWVWVKTIVNTTMKHMKEETNLPQSAFLSGFTVLRLYMLSPSVSALIIIMFCRRAGRRCNVIYVCSNQNKKKKIPSMEGIVHYKNDNFLKMYFLSGFPRLHLHENRFREMYH